MNALRILHIDDSASLNNAVHDFVTNIGLNHTVTFENVVFPRDEELFLDNPQRPFRPDDLSKFDLVLLDIELGDTWTTSLALESCQGMSVVLPHLRKFAPWLPVIACSRLFEHDNFVSLMSGVFDGLMIKESMALGGPKQLTRDQFEGLVENALINRQAACMGVHSPPASQVESTMCSDALVSKLLSFDEHCLEHIRTSFWFGKTLSIEQATQGFSGSINVKVYCEMSPMYGGRKTRWMTKLSTQPEKLQQEVEAHRIAQLGGVGNAFIVPPLWGNAIKSKYSSLALIGYQFAEDYSCLSEALELPTAEFLAKLKIARRPIEQLFRDRSIVAAPYSSIIKHIIGNTNWIQSQLPLIRGVDLHDNIVEILSNENDSYWGKVVEINQSLTHGDMHCDNIMMADQALLIDFSHSKFSYSLIDPSKLYSDIIMRSSVARRDIAQTVTKDCEYFKAISDIFVIGEEEGSLFRAFVAIHFLRYLQYDDIEDDAKQFALDWLSSISLLID